MNNVIKVQELINHLKSKNLVITTAAHVNHTVTPKYITGVKSLSSYTGLAPGTIQEYIKQGIIPKRKIGRKLIFNISEIDEAISEVQNKTELSH